MQGLKELVLGLHAGKVDFVIVGGFAAIAQGSSLVTRDVDVVCSMEPTTLLRLFDVFQELHPVHRMTPERLPFTREQAERGGLKNLYLSTDWGQLDCLGDVKGIGDYFQCLARSEVIDMDGAMIRVLSLDAIIEAKRAMNRPRDYHAVVELEAIRERRAD